MDGGQEERPSLRYLVVSFLGHGFTSSERLTFSGARKTSCLPALSGRVRTCTFQNLYDYGTVPSHWT